LRVTRQYRRANLMTKDDRRERSDDQKCSIVFRYPLSSAVGDAAITRIRVLLSHNSQWSSLHAIKVKERHTT